MCGTVENVATSLSEKETAATSLQHELTHREKFELSLLSCYIILTAYVQCEMSCQRIRPFSSLN